MERPRKHGERDWCPSPCRPSPTHTWPVIVRNHFSQVVLVGGDLRGREDERAREARVFYFRARAAAAARRQQPRAARALFSRSLFPLLPTLSLSLPLSHPDPVLWLVGQVLQLAGDQAEGGGRQHAFVCWERRRAEERKKKKRRAAHKCGGGGRVRATDARDPTVRRSLAPMRHAPGWQAGGLSEGVCAPAGKGLNVCVGRGRAARREGKSGGGKPTAALALHTPPNPPPRLSFSSSSSPPPTTTAHTPLHPHSLSLSLSLTP